MKEIGQEPGFYVSWVSVSGTHEVEVPFPTYAKANMYCNMLWVSPGTIRTMIREVKDEAGVYGMDSPGREGAEEGCQERSREELGAKKNGGHDEAEQ